MSAVGGGGIFVSYRREDSRDVAGRLADRLIDRFGVEQIFIDVEKIEPGTDFAATISQAIDGSAVLVAVIGQGWLSAVNREGSRRLDDPGDLVRLEIGTALARGVRVIPVLLERAVMPREEDLPDSLRGLARLHALPVRYESFHHDAGRLVKAIERELAQPAGGNDLVRADRLLTNAERIANYITDESERTWALCSLAGTVAVTDPDRYARLADDIERFANAITGKDAKARALSNLAVAVAATDPDRAERIAYSIVVRSVKAQALSSVAKAVAGADRRRYARLVGDVERIADSITSRDAKAWALSGVVAAVAVTDPDRAERIAKSIGYEPKEALSLMDGLKAAWEPGRAKAQALSEVAKAVAVTDPNRALRILRSAHDGPATIRVLGDLAGAVAVTDPDQAERIAYSITVEFVKAQALSEVAKAVAATDRRRYARLVGDAERVANSITRNEHAKALALSGVAVAVAVSDPDRAERIADSITEEYPKVLALSGVARALAA